MTAGRFTLSAGQLRAQVVPAVGGSIARLDCLGFDGSQPLLRGHDGDYTDVLDAGCFPLVPFANRIRGGRFVCDGREVRLLPNMAGDASPLHGQGWRAAWTVDRVEADSIEMAYRHPAGDWPWAYEAHQRIVLSPQGMSVTLSCRNLADTPMPCGLGLHPYYPCDAQTRLDTQVRTAWTIDDHALPVEPVPAIGRYDLRQRPVCGQGLDNGFDGWSGRARIDWPGRPVALRLESDDAGRFQLYSPASGGVFVAEPVQNANAALNAPQACWRELGIELLPPEGVRTLTAHFLIAPGA